MDIVAEKTVLCVPNQQSSTGYAELLTLDGITLNVDVPGGFGSTATQLVIEGKSYLPLASSIEITKTDGGVSVVTAIAVTDRD